MWIKCARRTLVHLFFILYSLINHKGDTLNLKTFARRSTIVATVAGLVLADMLMFTAQAAPRTVVLTQPSPLSGLNSSVTEMNLATNSEVMYPTGFGFYYANDAKKLIPNTKFGTWKSKKDSTGFRVSYTVKPNQTWNDGTPIDAVDLLLTHVVSSEKWSIDAGLGDPSAGVTAFDSLGYGGTYTKRIKSTVLSDNNMTLTLVYDKAFADWDQYAPGPVPVHALSLLADGKTALGTAAQNKAAKAKFLDDYLTKDTARFKLMGKIWSTSYNITTINASTNPLLLVSNGGFKLQSCIDQISCTLVIDPVTNGMSGPETTGIDKIVYRFDIADTSAPQALANKEIDLYQGQVTADGLTQLKAIKTITVDSGPQSTYEQLSLRTAGPNDVGDYKGPFAGETKRARELRRAFLLAVPREDMIQKIILPTDPGAVVLNSRNVMPSDGAAYKSYILANGVKQYFGASYTARMAEATSLMNKLVPDWKTKPVVINLLHRNNARRTAQCQLYAASWAKVGFKVACGGRADWSSQTSNLEYDAGLFAWGASLPVQVGDCPQTEPESPNSTWGWVNLAIEKNCSVLKGEPLREASRNRYWQSIEKEQAKNAYTLPLFQWPGATAIASTLKGVKPSPITPNLVWNYWEWSN
jgi:peptide/nickel transport system substrate-binding protein